MPIERFTTVVIGAGHTGLATSRMLSERSIDHVVLERGEIARSWRRERWDSLRLLTPNFQSRLPGHAYAGDDPNGFMSMREVVAFIDEFAAKIHAPVRTQTEVTSVRAIDGGYRVATLAGADARVRDGDALAGERGGGRDVRAGESDGRARGGERGEIECRTVVIASGACNAPSVPALAGAVPSSVASFTPFHYKNPASLPDGGVLVVGASATGVQLADELRRSGRPVMLSVGEHVRLPRTYRGRDVLWWMEATGLSNQRYDEIDDIERARKLPSPQLVGSRERATLDLNALGAAGVEIVGRLAAIRGGRALFSGGLRNHFALADLKMNRLLDTFDEWARGRADLDALVAASGTDAEAAIGSEADRPDPTRATDSPRLGLDLASGEIRSIVWATGFTPDYRWLDVPVLDRKGRLVHDGGVTHAPGLYAIGLPVLRRRKSTFIHGAEDDARDIVEHLARSLG